jgi:hypothetical protein
LFKFQLADAEETAQGFYEEIKFLKLKIEGLIHQLDEEKEEKESKYISVLLYPNLFYNRHWMYFQ